MSILIKGMEMPEDCCQCEWHERYGGDYDWCHACRLTGTMPIKNAETGRAEDCPLVEIPKHGDLIDREILCHDLSRFYENEVTARGLIYEQPVVIEAEDE